VNLFLSTRRLTSSKEDHLTEFLAAALQSDSSIRDAYGSLVLGAYAAKAGWAAPQILEVQTQRNFTGTGCCPDLTLTLRDGHVIASEHKIEAPETAGEESDDKEAVLQLERYLRLPVDGVAYFRSTWSPPASSVLEDPKYIKPRAREHFLWSDLYPVLQARTTDLGRWLLEAFEFLGYTPPHPEIGDLGDPDPTIRAAHWENFAKLWQDTRSALRERGWKVTAGSVCQLYLQSHASSVAEQVFVSPMSNGGRILTVRVTPRDECAVPDIMARFRHLIEALGLGVELEDKSVRRVSGHRAVIDVAIALRKLLPEHATAEELERKLLSYVVPLVDAIDDFEQAASAVGPRD
jgi:hypothetical protein